MKEKRKGERLPWPDWLHILCWTAAITTVVLLAWIVLEIFSQALPSIRKFGLQFFIHVSWDPNTNRFGVLPFLVGTAMSSVLALLIALPLGVAIAIFLSEDFLPAVFRQSIRFVIELLAAIPSVV